MKLQTIIAAGLLIIGFATILPPRLDAGPEPRRHNVVGEAKLREGEQMDIWCENTKATLKRKYSQDYRHPVWGTSMKGYVLTCHEAPR